MIATRTWGRSWSRRSAADDAGWETPPALLRWAATGSVPRAVPAMALLLVAIATSLSATHGWMTLYNDARAHLDIARRVTDGLTPGLAQLGSVWLPLPQVLMVPIAAVRALWQTGAAGAIVNGAAFVYGAMRIFSLAEEWTGKRLAGWAAFAVWVANINLLYVQSTALDECVMLACIVGAAYHMTRWMRTHALSDMVIAGVLTMMATMSRYEGWGLLAAEIVVVAVWTWMHNRRPGAVQGNTILFAFVAAYAILPWFLYNLIIFHDPLYFMHASVYTAQSQEAGWRADGIYTAQGNVVRTVLTYAWAIIDDAGIAVVLAAVAGAVMMLVRAPASRYRSIAVLAILAAPVLFDLVVFYTGQTVLFVPQVPPHQMFNIRFGLEAMPLLAVCAGSLASFVSSRRLAVPAVIGAAALSLTLATALPVTLREGLSGTSSFARTQVASATAYLAQHYHGGEILASDQQADPFIFGTGLDLRTFVTDGFHPYHDQAVLDPAAHVTWVVAYTDDAIYNDVTQHPDRFAGFTLVFRDRPISLYELTTAAR